MARTSGSVGLRLSPRRLLAVAVVLCGLGLSFFTPIAPLPVAAGYAAGGVLMVRNAGRLPAREARAWRVIGSALLTAVVGMVAVAVASALDPGLPTFSRFDLIFLSSYAIAAVGVALLPQQSERGGSGIRTLLDGVVGAVSVATLLWVYVAADLVDALRDADPWPRAIGSITIVADLSLLVVLIIVLVRRSSQRFDPRLIALAVGMAFQALGNIIFFSSGVATAITSSAQPYPVFALAGLFFALGGILVGWDLRGVQYPEGSPPLWVLFAPYAAAFLVSAAAVGEGLRSRIVTGDGALLTVAAAVVVVLTIARQALAIRANARRVEAERRRLVASVSHELRTPLTGVVGFLEVLADPDLPEPERREMQALALDEARVLGRIVGDLIDLSRGTLHETSLVLSDVRIDDLAEEVAFAAGPAAMSVDVPRGLRARLDRARMTQALAHLVANAERYGRGRIDIVAVVSGPDVSLEVHDDGPGVPRRFERLIWDRFERGAHALDAANPGSGIGLTVVDAVARAHGGEAYYRRSERLGGACFVIRLPGSIIVPLDAPEVVSEDLH